MQADKRWAGHETGMDETNAATLCRALVPMYAVDETIGPRWLLHVPTPLVLGVLLWLYEAQVLPVIVGGLFWFAYVVLVHSALVWWMLKWQVRRRVRALGPEETARLVREFELTPTTPADQLQALIPKLMTAMYERREKWHPTRFDFYV